MVQKRGRPERQDVEPFRAAGFSKKQILDVVLAIAVKTISDYTNHLFETPATVARDLTRAVQDNAQPARAGISRAPMRSARRRSRME
jgi:hypothetical protein